VSLYAAKAAVLIFSAQLCHLTLQITALTLSAPSDNRIGFKRLRFIAQAVTIIVAFMAFHWLRFGLAVPNPNYRGILQALVCIWLLTASLFHGFDVRQTDRIVTRLWTLWVSEAVITVLMLGLLVATAEVSHSRLILLLTIAISVATENILTTSAILRVRALEGSPSEQLEEQDDEAAAVGPFSRTIFASGAGARVAVPDLAYDSVSPPSELPASYRSYLQASLGGRWPGIFDFVDEFVDLGLADRLASAIFAASAHDNLTFSADGRLSLVINLEPINATVDLSQYLKRVNQKLCINGLLIGVFQSYGQRRRQIFKIFPKPVGFFVHAAETIFLRILPRLPLVGRIVSRITGRKARRISLTESLGRLCRSGFEIVRLSEIGDAYGFIARKAAAAPSGPDPEYGLIFRQRRVGYGGRPILVYKLRTMHPYADCLHDHLLRNAVIAQNGKLAQDFRTPGWGRFLRRWWIDELPMLVNLARGELKWVGVRPISYSFLQVYPEDLRQERSKYRPGLIPPFYADLPEGLEEIMASERRYLEQYRNAPNRTDIQYFAKAFRNIIFLRARSS
jgi:hypothetical protein